MYSADLMLDAPRRHGPHQPTPCPLCRGRPASAQYMHGWYVRCATCRHSTAVYALEWEAWAAWYQPLERPPVPPGIIQIAGPGLEFGELPRRISWDSTPRQVSLVCTKLADELRTKRARTPAQRRALAELTADVLAMAAMRLWDVDRDRRR